MNRCAMIDIKRRIRARAVSARAFFEEVHDAQESDLQHHGAIDSASLVTIIVVMSETRSLADVKAHLSEIVDLVENQHERVIITRNGRPAAVIISPDDLENLEETLELLSMPGALEEIRATEDQVAEGSFLTAAELRAKYLTRE